MAEYRGYIAVISREDAVSWWLRRRLPGKPAVVFEAFCHPSIWTADEFYGCLGASVVLPGGVKYTAWQYSTRKGGDTLVLACEYSNEWLAPGGKFAVEGELRAGARLTELVEGDVLTQIRKVLGSVQ